MKINLQSVIDEIESAEDGIVAYYDPRTETIVYDYRYDPSAGTYDPDEYDSAIPLPDRRRIDDYHKENDKYICIQLVFGAYKACNTTDGCRHDEHNNHRVF